MKTDLLHFGYLNKNNRIYREKDIDLNELNKNPLLGEINHPSRFLTDLSLVSHKITNLEIYGDALYGEVKILETPKGCILKELMKNTRFVFRPRASGTVNSNGTINNYKIHTFDAILASEDSFDRTSFRRLKIEKIIWKLKNK